MSKDWVIPTVQDAYAVVQIYALTKSNENIDAASVASTATEGAAPEGMAAYDPSKDSRLTTLLEFAVTELRQNIENAGRVPLSVTAGAVPPEGVRRVAIKVAYELISTSSSWQMMVLTAGDNMSSPLGKLYAEAMKWYSEVAEGKVVTDPTDPVGQDGETAVSDDNPAQLTGVRWGDNRGDQTDYEDGTLTAEDMNYVL